MDKSGKGDVRSGAVNDFGGIAGALAKELEKRRRKIASRSDEGSTLWFLTVTSAECKPRVRF